jgi:PKD repeat protein
MRGRKLSLLLAILLAVVSIVAAGVGAAPAKGRGSAPAPAGGRTYIFVENELVRISVQDLDGSFGIGTSADHPSRPCEPLLYGFSCQDNSNTSHIVLIVDGLIYGPSYFSDCDGVYDHMETSIVGNSIVSSYALRQPPLEITCRFTPELFSPDTGAILIETEVVNLDEVDHQIGVLYELDTQVADNDAAELAAGGVWYQVETCFEPPTFSYWEAFEGSIPPGPTDLIGRGTLVGGAAVPPDRFAVGYWSNFVDVCWDYDCSGLEFDDSAVLYWWFPETVTAGASRRVATYYGVGEVEVTPGDLTISLSYQTELSCDEFGELTPNPFDLTAYITNAGSSTCTDVVLELTLPDGLVTEDPLQLSVGDMAPGQQEQGYWTVTALGSPCDQTLSFQVEARSTSCDTNMAEGGVWVPCCATPVPSPTATPEYSPTPWPTPEPGPTCLPLAAGFTAISPGLFGQPIRFQDRSSGEIRDWFWRFGDGSTSRDLYPLHTYAAPGTYNVILQVTDRCGTQATHAEDVEVRADPLPPDRLWVGRQVLDNIDVISDQGWIISWVAPPGPVEQYELERLTSENGVWTPVVRTSDTAWTEQETFPSNTLVYYRLRSANNLAAVGPWVYSTGLLYWDGPVIERVDAAGSLGQQQGFTNSRDILISLVGIDPAITEVRISEDPGFAGAPWQARPPDVFEVPYELEPGDDGLRIVYVQGRDASQAPAPPLSTAILLDTTPPELDSLVLRDLDTGALGITDQPDVLVELLVAGEAREMAFGEGADCEPGPWQPLAEGSFPFRFADAAPGLKTFCLWLRDRAGNVSGPHTAEIHLATEPPSLPSFTIRDLSSGDERFTSGLEVEIDLGAGDGGGGGLEGYPNELRIWEDDEAEPEGWSAFPGLVFTYALRHTGDGPHTVHVRLRDGLGRQSAVVSASITLDRTPPRILVAGYWDTYLDTINGGTLTMLVLLDEANPARVELLYEGEPTGLELVDDGSGGDWVAGDTLYTRSLDVGALPAPMRLLFTLRAVDLAGNRSDEWPYLTIHGDQPSAGSAAAPGAWRELLAELWSREELSGARWRSGRFTTAAAAPMIMLGGVWDTALTSADGGTLSLLAYVPGAETVDILYGDRPTGARLLDDGSQGDFGAGDGVWGLKAPVGSGLPAGRWIWQLQATAAGGETSDTFPYLTIHHVNQAPSATIISPTTGCYSGTINLVGSGTDPDGDTLTYSWFDNGNSLGSGNPLEVTLAPGNHEIMLVVSDPSGAQGSDKSQIAVDPDPLQVTLQSTVLTAGTPLSVRFEASVTGGLPEYRYLWDFGDGETLEGPATVEHTYYTAGDYQAQVTVQDQCGTEAVADAGAQSAENQPPNVSILLPSGGMEFTDRDTFHLLGQGSDPEEGQLPPLALSWLLDEDPLGTGADIPVQHLEADEYIVTLTGVDSAGQTGQTQTQLRIGHFTPVRDASLSYDGIKATCRLEIEDMLAGEMLRWTWTLNGGSEVVQTFTATVDIPNLTLAQAYPYPLASGDVVAATVGYFGGRWSDFHTEFTDSLTVP